MIVATRWTPIDFSESELPLARQSIRSKSIKSRPHQDGFFCRRSFWSAFGGQERVGRYDHRWGLRSLLGQPESPFQTVGRWGRGVLNGGKVGSRKNTNRQCHENRLEKKIKMEFCRASRPPVTLKNTGKTARILEFNRNDVETPLPQNKTRESPKGFDLWRLTEHHSRMKYLLICQLKRS